MKTKNENLDVDFIGEQIPLSSEDEKALSDFFRHKKEANKKHKTSLYKTVKGNKTTV